MSQFSESLERLFFTSKAFFFIFIFRILIMKKIDAFLTQLYKKKSGQVHTVSLTFEFFYHYSVEYLNVKKRSIICYRKC